jgi:hypothetical protein
MGRYRPTAAPTPDGQIPEVLFTENETNFVRLYGVRASGANYSKDAFHRYLITKELDAVSPSKEAARWRFLTPWT